MVKAYGGALIIADALLLLLKILYYILESVYRFFVPVEEKSVAGEIVLITGTGHGIGRELALRYASLGATVVCWDLNREGNEETLKEIKKIGGANAYAYKCDVTNREEVFKLAEKVKEEVGNVTILVNNAGIMPCHTMLSHTAEEIRKIFDVNVLAHFWMLQAFLPSMIANNHGHVIALSSMAGLVGLPNLVPYCASKFAVRGLMEAMHEEVRVNAAGQSSNVKFTTIYPYMVDTGLCKKPRIRFSSLMAMVPPQEAANEIIRAQRRNVIERTIPCQWMSLNGYVRLLPIKASICIKDFVDSGVDSD